MSQYLDSLKVGDEVTFKGPVGHFTYEGKGHYTMHKHKGIAEHLSMVAGGTGITPCYAVLVAVLKDAEDTTQCSLIFANQAADDILLKDELDALANNHPDRFRVSWSGGEV
jgi:ferredoxin-NADP reductase